MNIVFIAGWRRSHRPSIRDISIIDEEETGEKDAEAEESSPPASPIPAANSTPTAAPITVQPNHRTWPHCYRPHYFFTYACFEYIYRYAHSVRLRFMADTNYQSIDRKRRKTKSKSRLITKVWRTQDVLSIWLVRQDLSIDPSVRE